MVGVGSGTSKEALETTPIDNQNATPEGESMFHLHYLVLLHNQSRIRNPMVDFMIIFFS